MTNNRILPKHPVYIISKGRADSMLTSRALAEMKLPHFIAIEPQDVEPYEKALDKFNIRDYVTLLELPFSNHGDGPGRARNWCWDHSIENGATYHWVLDDNIRAFYRYHNNYRIPIVSGVCFRAPEDFVERYDNVPISGLNYKSFVPEREQRPAFVKNTRIYSCLLIRNDCKFRWRGRYNEDTDLSLRVLKDGDCTIQFNMFLQDKLATQVLKGGNTEEFYHKENADSKEGYYNPDGTIKKSAMLVAMHPDVARMAWRHGRWHHYVDYSPFKINKLKLKQDVDIINKPNEYGLRLKTFPSKEALDEYLNRN